MALFLRNCSASRCICSLIQTEICRYFLENLATVRILSRTSGIVPVMDWCAYCAYPVWSLKVNMSQSHQTHWLFQTNKILADDLCLTVVLCTKNCSQWGKIAVCCVKDSNLHNAKLRIMKSTTIISTLPLWKLTRNVSWAHISSLTSFCFGVTLT